MSRPDGNDGTSYSRRRFLFGGFLDGLRRADEANEGVSVAAGPSTVDAPRPPVLPVLRPPGARAESDFLSRCTRCHDCMQACPHDTLVPASTRLRSAAGTPTFEPNRQPCWLCPDTPCATACPTGALIPGQFAQVGVAKILGHACLARTGTCTVCSEQCPVEGALQPDDQGRPRVDETLCTGCGVCQYVCPAPETAVLVLPSVERRTLSPDLVRGADRTGR